jgi:hypothetical protein
MVGKYLAEAIAQLGEKSRRSLDVREEECEGAAW